MPVSFLPLLDFIIIIIIIIIIIKARLQPRLESYKLYTQGHQQGKQSSK